MLFNKFEKELKEAQSKLDMNKVGPLFPGGKEQIDNIGREINYYTNGKINSKDIYKLYIRDSFFFKMDGDTYALYQHMKMRYGNLLTEEEQINLMAIIFRNIANPEYKFNKNDNFEIEIEYIKNTIKTTDENSSEGIMKGAYGVFGKEKTNPIPVNGHMGLNMYLRSICLNNGHDIKIERVAACGSDNINGIIDLYTVYDAENDERVCDLFICIYNKYTSKVIPEGFKLKGKQ